MDDFTRQIHDLSHDEQPFPITLSYEAIDQVFFQSAILVGVYFISSALL